MLATVVDSSEIFDLFSRSGTYRTIANERKMAKSLEPSAISPYDKDSDNLLMSVSIVVSIVLSNPFKMFNPIEEDGLDLLECRVVPILSHRLEASEMVHLLSYTRTFRRPKGRICSGIAIKMGGEEVQSLYWSFCSLLHLLEFCI
jgi:hypothetical protein